MKRVTIMAHVDPDICRGCRVCEKSVPSMPFMSPIGRRRWRNPTAGVCQLCGPMPIPCDYHGQAGRALYGWCGCEPV